MNRFTYEILHGDDYGSFDYAICDNRNGGLIVAAANDAEDAEVICRALESHYAGKDAATSIVDKLTPASPEHPGKSQQPEET